MPDWNMAFVKFGPANCESIGNIHRESNWVFPVNSYILSRVRMKLLKSENFYSIFRTIFLSLLRQAQFKPRSFNCIIGIAAIHPLNEVVREEG